MLVESFSDNRHFYPRSPCGERPLGLPAGQPITPDFYPRSPCGERLHYDNYNLHCVEISIHALLAESDHEQAPYIVWETQISIHALLAESDRSWTRWPTTRLLFLSTLSLRRATQ